MTDSNEEFLRSQLESARASLLQAEGQNDFLKNRLILEQVDRAFQKAGGNPEIEPDQVRSMLSMFGDIELVGGEVGFRRKAEKELLTLTKGMEIIKRSETLASMFSPPTAAPESLLIKNEFGMFRRR